MLCLFVGVGTCDRSSLVTRNFVLETLHDCKSRSGLKSLSQIHFVKIHLTYFLGNEFFVEMNKL